MARLKTLPALFAYERGVDAPAVVGRIKTIKKRQDAVSATFQINRLIRPIHPATLHEIRWQLDIGDLELNRTHWAVKDVDLMDVLCAEGHPGQPKIFLAHASEDKKRVRELYKELGRAGFNPWLDEEDILGGQNWRVEIRRAIHKAGIFLACLSKHSVTKRGTIQSELRNALTVYGERPPNTIWFVPVKLEECEVPDLEISDEGIRLKDLQWIELWTDNGHEKLIKTINASGAELLPLAP